MCTIGTRTGNQVRYGWVGFNGISKIFYMIYSSRSVHTHPAFSAVHRGCCCRSRLSQTEYFLRNTACGAPICDTRPPDGAVAWSILAVLGEEDESPQLRIMNIDDAGRSPYPVVFRENISVFIGAFYVSVVLDIHIPLHTGEVHTVKFSVFRCAALFLVFVEMRRTESQPQHSSLCFQRKDR